MRSGFDDCVVDAQLFRKNIRDNKLWAQNLGPGILPSTQSRRQRPLPPLDHCGISISHKPREVFQKTIRRAPSGVQSLSMGPWAPAMQGRSIFRGHFGESAPAKHASRAPKTADHFQIGDSISQLCQKSTHEAQKYPSIPSVQHVRASRDTYV